MSAIRISAINAVLLAAIALAGSLAFGWYPLWWALVTCMVLVGALLLSLWIADKIVNHILDQRRQ